MKASTKELELREVVGKTTSCNWSPTGRAKLLKVNKKTCVLEIVLGSHTEYNSKQGNIGKIIKAPLEYTWNAFFY